MKQVILIRKDIDMSRGKAVAQGSHASVLAVREANEETIQSWFNENAGTKITLEVDSIEHLQNLITQAKDESLPTGMITDLGRTEIEGETTTAGAIGPASASKIDAITDDLNLYK